MLGIVFLIFATLTALALWDYDVAQNPRFSTGVTEINIVGSFGSNLAYYGILWLGLGAWAVVFSFYWIAIILFAGLSHVVRPVKFLMLLVMILSCSVFGSLIQTEAFDGASPVADSNYYPHGLGGWMGYQLYNGVLQSFIGMVGTIVVFGVLAVAAIVFLFSDNIFAGVRRFLASGSERLAAARAEREKQREEKRQIARANRDASQKKKKTDTQIDKQLEVARRQSEEDKKKARETEKSGGLLGFFKRRKKPETGPDSPTPFAPMMDAEEPAEDSAPRTAPRPVRSAPKPAPAAKRSNASEPVEELTPEEDEAFEPVNDAEDDTEEAATSGLVLRQPQNDSEKLSAGGLRIIASEPTRKANVKFPRRRGDFVFPPMTLLSEPASAAEEDSAEIHRQTADLLVRTLEEFGVKVNMGEVHAGPVITRYDVYPAPGVRVEKIVNLDKNIALGLKALSVRILAPVPGKGCVGIEVPNRHAQSVFIRDILESEDWVNTKAEIPIALGKEVSGKPLIADLTKMPHLLIAGSTGSGKTVCINTIITSLLYHASPDDIRFVMVDPKIVEMQVYNSLPHMLVPVVTDPKKVPNALKYLLNEMERRYQVFAQIGVRNIAGYNAKMAKGKQDRELAEAKAAALDAELTPEERAAASSISVPRDAAVDTALPEKLPYIVCVVDELADLMMVAPADIETGIARLAQLARAAGIHLILATQRPSVNVITGVIKANLPSRIAFKVASKVDSRTILDTMGADQLIGKGDMLFLPPGSADLVRSQGAFVGDDEITGIVEYIREHNGEPVFDEQFQRNIEEGDEEEGGSAEGDWDDELVPDAIEVIRTSKRASTSMLQRRLKIGYNRAARIMEILEAEGIVGPENGSSPREILRDFD